MNRRICNICGRDYDTWWDPWGDSDGEPCAHVEGRIYGGKTCEANASEPCPVMAAALPLIHEA